MVAWQAVAALDFVQVMYRPDGGFSCVVGSWPCIGPSLVDRQHAVAVPSNKKHLGNKTLQTYVYLLICIFILLSLM